VISAVYLVGVEEFGNEYTHFDENCGGEKAILTKKQMMWFLKI